MHALSLALAFAAAPQPAPGVDVQWQTTPACIDEASFNAHLTTMVPGAAGQPVELGAIEEAPGQWAVTIGLSANGSTVERRIYGDDCVLLTEAAALVVAVRSDPVASAASLRRVAATQAPDAAGTRPIAGTVDRSDATDPPQPTPDKPLRDAKSPPPEPPAATSRAAPRPSATRSTESPATPTWSAAVGAGVDIGSLPRAGGVVSAEASAAWKRLRLDVGVSAILGPPSRPTIGSVRATFRVFTGVARACALFGAGEWVAPLCVGLEAGGIQARPQGLTAPKDVDVAWLAPTAGARLQRQWGMIAPLVFVDLAVPALQHSFETGDAGVLHTLPAVVLRAGAGMRFGGP